MTHDFSSDDLVVDRQLSEIDARFQFLVAVTPVDLIEARTRFDATGRTPDFAYRPLQDDLAVTMQQLDHVAVDDVNNSTLASLLVAKQRELRLQLAMLSCRGSADFLALSIQLFGAATPALLAEAEHILSSVAPDKPDCGPWLDAHGFQAVAEAEINHYRAMAPNIESRVEIREASTDLMVSHGHLLVTPTVRVPLSRVDALVQHEIGTHVVTHVNGTNQPLRLLASGLAGNDETQEGLAVLAEHLVGGLTAGRLRQLAARVVAVHQMVSGATFPDIYAGLVDAGVPTEQAFTITTRVYRSGGLTKDVVYLRGLKGLVGHLGAGGTLLGLWLGKMPLSALPLVVELHQRGALVDPLLTPRFLDDPASQARLSSLGEARPLTTLIAERP